MEFLRLRCFCRSPGGRIAGVGAHKVTNTPPVRHWPALSLPRHWTFLCQVCAWWCHFTEFTRYRRTWAFSPSLRVASGQGGTQQGAQCGPAQFRAGKVLAARPPPNHPRLPRARGLRGPADTRGQPINPVARGINKSGATMCGCTLYGWAWVRLYTMPREVARLGRGF